MTIAGFQDFQEGTIWQSDIAFVESSNNQASGTTVTFPTTGTYVCSNWQATQFRCTTTLRTFDFTAQWFTDAAGFNQIGERRWSVYDGWPLATYLTTGNLGPYLKVQTSNFSGGAGSAFFRGIFTNRPLGPFQPGYSSPLASFNQTVNAGTQLSVAASYLYSGPAVLTYTVNGVGGWLGDVQVRDSAGTATSILYFGPRGGAVAEVGTFSFIIPPRPVWVGINNFGAAAAAIGCAISADVFR